MLLLFLALKKKKKIRWRKENTEEPQGAIGNIVSMTLENYSKSEIFSF